MTASYFNSHSLHSGFQKAYESVMSNGGFAVKDWPQQSGLVFGLRVDQAALNNYVSPLIPYAKSFHNPFSDSRFKVMPVRVISSQEPGQIKPPHISHKPGEYHDAEQNSRILSNQSEIRIERVWSMADEASSHSYQNAYYKVFSNTGDK